MIFTQNHKLYRWIDFSMSINGVSIHLCTRFHGLAGTLKNILGWLTYDNQYNCTGPETDKMDLTKKHQYTYSV